MPCLFLQPCGQLPVFCGPFCKVVFGVLCGPGLTWPRACVLPWGRDCHHRSQDRLTLLSLGGNNIVDVDVTAFWNLAALRVTPEDFVNATNKKASPLTPVAPRCAACRAAACSAAVSKRAPFGARRHTHAACQPGRTCGRVLCPSPPAHQPTTAHSAAHRAARSTVYAAAATHGPACARRGRSAAAAQARASLRSSLLVSATLLQCVPRADSAGNGQTTKQETRSPKRLRCWIGVGRVALHQRGGHRCVAQR